MITDKIFNSFYIIELTGRAAGLEFLVGKNFGIKETRLVSKLFTTDMHATIAAQDALQFFIDNNLADDESAIHECVLNPEFFPTAPPLELSPEQKQLAEEQLERAQEAAAENQVAIIINRNFDDLGDFVSTRFKISGDDYTAKVRIAVNPDEYLKEKSKMEEQRINTFSGPHRESTPHTHIH